MSALVLLVLLQFPTDVNENAFKKLDESDGVTMSKRDVKGSVFAEHRAELSSPNPVEAFCVAVFEWGSLSSDGPGITFHQVLTKGDDRRVIPLLDLAQINGRQHFAGELELALPDFFQVHDRHIVTAFERRPSRARGEVQVGPASETRHKRVTRDDGHHFL